MIGPYESPAEHARSEAAWLALAFGARSLRDDPLPDEEPLCASCKCPLGPIEAKSGWCNDCQHGDDR